MHTAHRKLTVYKDLTSLITLGLFLPAVDPSKSIRPAVYLQKFVSLHEVHSAVVVIGPSEI